MSTEDTPPTEDDHISKESKTKSPILSTGEATSQTQPSSASTEETKNKQLSKNYDYGGNVTVSSNDIRMPVESQKVVTSSLPTKNPQKQPPSKKMRPKKRDSRKRNAEAFLMGISLGDESEKRDKPKKAEPESEGNTPPDVEDREPGDFQSRDNKLRKRKRKAKRKSVKSSGGFTQRQLPLPPDENSLRPLFKSVKKPGKNGISYAALLPIHETYDPEFLDDQLTVPLKQKISIDLPGYKESFIPFMKPTKLKEQLNREFREKHSEWLKTNINLSDIRSVKNKIFQIALSLSLDISSVAHSYVYFEKLVLKNLVNKSNYKQFAAACFLLAVKFNGPIKNTIPKLLKVMAKFLASPKEVLNVEFTVFKELNFELLVDMNELLPHLRRLQSSEDYQDSLFQYNSQKRRVTETNNTNLNN
jgi:hypothetical protein